MKLKVDRTGIYLDDFKVRGVEKIDLIDLRPSSKIVALRMSVDEVDIQTKTSGPARRQDTNDKKTNC